MQNYYEILEVPTTASVEEITRSYKKLALQCHPDMIPRKLRKKNSEVSAATIQAAVIAGAKRFQNIYQAYSVLTDSEKRARYDRGETLDSTQSNA